MIRFRPELCTACGACAVACMDENDIDIARGERPFLRVERRERDGVIRYEAALCRHCARAPCGSVCPAGCLYKDGTTGLTLYDPGACLGCGACAGACPFDAIGFYGDPPRMGKCHGCVERLRAGLAPVCVRNCPTGALTEGGAP